MNCARRAVSMPFHSRARRSIVFWERWPACRSLRRAPETPCCDNAVMRLLVCEAWREMPFRRAVSAPASRGGRRAVFRGDGAADLFAAGFRAGARRRGARVLVRAPAEAEPPEALGV